MTGIERLRRLARSQNMDNAWTAMLAHELCDIADQIERERECERDTIENLRMELGEARDHAADVSTSAYDLLPKEERDAIAWVCEHGGLDYVKSEWRSRVPHDRYERGRQSLLRHIAECEAALGRRNQRIEELEGRVNGLETENAELRKRAMPEGMEWLVEAWPRFEDGTRLAFEDELPDFAHTIYKTVKTVKFIAGGTAEVTNGGGSANVTVVIRPGERVKRPAPKVLDADGVEIRVGDVLYRKSDGHMVKVAEVYEKTFTDADDYVRPGDGFTHRAPVIAADGKPLREGEHVYHVETGAELVVKKLPKPGEYQAVVVFAPPASHLTSFDPDQLTHERPDSWERLERDANASTCTYFGATTKDCEICGHVSWECSYDKASDLVRRAKKLAGDA